MTFNFAPWAIDGARSAAGLARLASYAAGGGRSGVVNPSDLSVSALAVPGNGLRISSGGASVLNHYLSDPDEAYVVSNPASHTVLAADMPSPQPSTSYYLVCVVIGDPEFNQTGHPFMPSGPLAPEDAPDFQYVRVVIVPCNPTTSSFEDLGYNYPAYALARLEIPPSTSTITNAMITDLRSLAKPRESTRLLVAQPIPAGPGVGYVSTDWETVWSPQIQVPKWATYVESVGFINSIVHLDPELVGQTRLVIDGYGGASSYHELPDTSGAGERVSLSAVWAADVSGIAGTTVNVSLQVAKISGSGSLQAYSDTTCIIDVRFSERPI